MTFLQDYVDGLKTIREARKSGMTVKAGRELHCIQTSSWYATMEGCLLQGELNTAVKTVFDRFDEETKHALTFSPSHGEWAERAGFWKDALRPVLSPKQYSAAMEAILSHYISCVRQRLEDKTATLY